ncbi:MAG: hypothetical protein ILA52_00745 [Alphaproteobacteria bacterium]|nr:hypothetical protein [Alphaproteobacteria bacterium]
MTNKILTNSKKFIGGIGSALVVFGAFTWMQYMIFNLETLFPEIDNFVFIYNAIIFVLFFARSMTAVKNSNFYEQSRRIGYWYIACNMIALCGIMVCIFWEANILFLIASLCIIVTDLWDQERICKTMDRIYFVNGAALLYVVGTHFAAEIYGVPSKMSLAEITILVAVALYVWLRPIVKDV